jgi:hypothetical protein
MHFYFDNNYFGEASPFPLPEIYFRFASDRMFFIFVVDAP